jgi:hypothetical protein
MSWPQLTPGRKRSKTLKKPVADAEGVPAGHDCMRKEEVAEKQGGDKKKRMTYDEQAKMSVSRGKSL